MDNSNAVARCHNCKWWVGNPLVNDLEHAQGECHRNPPQVAGLVPRQTIQGPQPMAITAFPTVNAMSGCGEHTWSVQVMQ